MFEVRLTNPTGRDTQAHIVTMGDCCYYFSYETCIGFSGQSDGDCRSVRLKNRWGPTTGRHFNEMLCGNFPIVSDNEFEYILENAEYNT